MSKCSLKYLQRYPATPYFDQIVHVKLQFFVLLHHFIAHENVVAAAELFDFLFFLGHASDVLLFQQSHGFVHVDQFLDLLVGGEGTGGWWWWWWWFQKK